MKNSADLGGRYPPRPSASVDNTLLELQNSSYPTQPRSIIAKYRSTTPLVVMRKLWPAQSISALDGFCLLRRAVRSLIKS